MKYKDMPSKIKDQEKSKLINSSNKLNHLKSNFILKKIFDYIHKRKSLETIKCNKSIQKRMNININHYKEYSEKYSSIEIEIKPMKNKYCRFINVVDYKKEYYHIYYNDNKEKEIKSTYLNENDKVSKINIVIDYKVTSFYQLFNECKYIEYIYFKKFYRNNITNMGWMFNECKSLKELNFNNFNTNNVTIMSGMFRECSSLNEINLNNFNTINVTDMSGMFFGCSSLKELNLNNLNTNNVTNMSGMFEWCSSLKELNLNNFNTNNVTDMSDMFCGCSSLKELNLSHFNTDNVTDMGGMFNDCSSLKELNLINFNTNNVSDIYRMFSKCSDELKLKIKNKFKIFKKEAFEDYQY